MSLIEVRQLTSSSRLGLWRIEQTDIPSGSELSGTSGVSVHLSPRQRERQAVEQLLRAMTGNPSASVGHEASGKPFVQLAGQLQEVPSVHPQEEPALPHEEPAHLHEEPAHPHEVSALPHISISHTTGYAALILSDAEEVGIDIEYLSDRVERIAPRFIRYDEHAETTLQKLLLWSAKETVYKLFSEDALGFFDMRLLTFADGLMRVENIKRKIIVDVCYETTDDYVLTYAVLPF